MLLSAEREMVRSVFAKRGQMKSERTQAASLKALTARNDLGEKKVA